MLKAARAKVRGGALKQRDILKFSKRQVGGEQEGF
jgi:hypothetical protein